MAYTADITQNITPSAPDPSGAISSIQSQASIAKTMFGGLTEGYETYKQSTLKSALEEAQGLQLSALQQSQKEIKAAEELTLAESLAGPPTPEGKEIPFKAEIDRAATRLKEVKDAGGFNRESDYYTRVANLVDKYAAMLPGAKQEIRALVAKGSGLEGADLWAQQQYIKQMFSPKEQKVAEDKLAQEARQMQLKRVVDLGIDPVEANRLQNSQDPDDMALWQNYTVTAQQAAMLKSASDQAELRAKSLAQTNSMNVEQNGQAFRQAAAMSSRARAEKVFATQQQKIQELSKRMASGQWGDSDDVEVSAIMLSIVGEAEKAHLAARQSFNASLPVNISEDVRKAQLARFDEQIDTLKKQLNLSDPAMMREMSKALLTSKEKNIDQIFKLAQVNKFFTDNLIDSPEMRMALGVDEFNTDGTLSPEWKRIKDAGRESVFPFLRTQREIIKSGLSIVQQNQLLAAHPVSISLSDAQTSPNATQFPQNASKEDKRAAVTMVATGAAEITNKAFESSKMQQGPSQELTKAFVATAKDVNCVGAALCNASQGNAVTIIKENTNQFKDFYSKLKPEQQNILKGAVSFEVEQSLEAARIGLGDINKKYGVQLQFGVDKGSQTFGIVPPPPDRFYDPRTSQFQNFQRGQTPANQVGSPSNLQLRFGAEVPKAFKKYYPNMVVKPEYVSEVAKLGEAANEWNNQYLPRVAGSFTSQSIVNNESEFLVAQNFMRAVRDNKRLPSFYNFSAPSAAEDGGGVATVQVGGIEIKNATPEIVGNKISELLKTDNLDPNTRAKLEAIIADMAKERSGVETNQSKK